MSLLVMLFFAAACDKVEKKMDSKEEIFSCSAENIIGISSIYMDEGAVTLVFDEDEVFDEESRIGLRFVFKNGLYDQHRIYIITKDEECVPVDMDSLKIGNMTLSFDAEDVDASDIARIQFSVSDQYIIDIENMELSATGFGCDCIEYYSQCYDSGSDSWDEIEYRFVACPEECFDD